MDKSLSRKSSKFYETPEFHSIINNERYFYPLFINFIYFSSGFGSTPIERTGHEYSGTPAIFSIGNRYKIKFTVRCIKIDFKYCRY